MEYADVVLTFIALLLVGLIYIISNFARQEMNGQAASHAAIMDKLNELIHAVGDRR